MASYDVASDICQSLDGGGVGHAPSECGHHAGQNQVRAASRRAVPDRARQTSLTTSSTRALDSTWHPMMWRAILIPYSELAPCVATSVHFTTDGLYMTSRAISARPSCQAPFLRPLSDAEVVAHLWAGPSGHGVLERILEAAGTAVGQCRLTLVPSLWASNF